MNGEVLTKDQDFDSQDVQQQTINVEMNMVKDEDPQELDEQNLE